MKVSRQNPNIAQLAAAAAQLEPLLNKIAFVGGCVTGLLVTDPAAAPVRPTLDVDVIVEASSYVEFTVLEQTLRHLGFHESRTEGAPVCRWVSGDLILDFMPTDPLILGFSNRWYRGALENSEITTVGEFKIRIVSAPYFIATKIEAFHGRGKNDFQMSHDLEDIVTVVDGRAEITNEVRIASAELQKYLSDQFRSLLSNRDFVEAIQTHLLPDAASQQRLGLVISRMQQLVMKE